MVQTVAYCLRPSARTPPTFALTTKMELLQFIKQLNAVGNIERCYQNKIRALPYRYIVHVPNTQWRYVDGTRGGSVEIPVPIAVNESGTFMVYRRHKFPDECSLAFGEITRPIGSENMLFIKHRDYVWGREQWPLACYTDKKLERKLNG
jgi:hypothetical protein